MAAQRFMFLNDLDAAQLRFTMSRLRHSPAQFRGSCLDYSGRRLPSPGNYDESIRPFVRDFAVCALRNTSGWQATFVARNSPLRYCPDCLRCCFHANLYQQPIVRRCPYHGSPLTDVCPHCRQPMAYFHLPAGPQRAMQCAGCGHAWMDLPAMAVETVRGMPEAEETIAAAARTLDQMTLVQFVKRQGAFPLRGHSDNYIDFVAHAAHAVSQITASKPGWLAGLQSPILCAVKPASKPTSLKPMWYETKDATRQFNLRWRERVAALRALHRHLAKRMQAICRHKPCLSYRPYSMFSRHGLHHFLILSGRHCPCCAALAWWRLHMGKYLAWAQAHRLPQRVLLEILGDQLDIEMMQCDLGEFTVNAANLFCSLAISLTESIDDPSETDPGLQRWLRAITGISLSAREVQALGAWRWQREQFGHLLLPLPRWDGPVSAKMEWAARGGAYNVAYSIRNAEDALRACRQRHRPGPLWEFEGEEVPKDSRRDIWGRKYLKSGAYVGEHGLFFPPEPESPY